ncbi:MAG: sulfite exporter TauE/SafE family protein [Pseudomonadota bacterium]
MPELAPEIWAYAVVAAAIAGLIKGVVGFAMPMVMISSLAVVLPPDLALAALILPTLATNTWQALRTGWADAVEAMRDHWRYLLVVWGFIAASAQLIYVLPEAVMFLILGLPVTFFSLAQLVGWRLRFAAHARRRVEIMVASFAGFVGGLSGVWGPPTVAYLTALETPKFQSVRVQGVVYGSGAVVLALAHLKSGVVTAGTAQMSALLLIPALAGLWLGFQVQDRMDQEAFRRATLVVLVVAGLNLVRRGLFW